MLFAVGGSWSGSGMTVREGVVRGMVWLPDKGGKGFGDSRCDCTCGRTVGLVYGGCGLDGVLMLLLEIQR